MSTKLKALYSDLRDFNVRMHEYCNFNDSGCCNFELLMPCRTKSQGEKFQRQEIQKVKKDLVQRKCNKWKKLYYQALKQTPRKERKGTKPLYLTL